MNILVAVSEQITTKTTESCHYILAWIIWKHICWASRLILGLGKYKPRIFVKHWEVKFNLVYKFSWSKIWIVIWPTGCFARPNKYLNKKKKSKNYKVLFLNLVCIIEFRHQLWLKMPVPRPSYFQFMLLHQRAECLEAVALPSKQWPVALIPHNSYIC